MVKRYFFITALSLLILYPCLFGVAVPSADAQPPRGEGVSSRIGNGGLQPVLTVNIREVDLGALGPGEEAKGVFYLRNVGSGSLDWSTEGPEGWTRVESQSLSGVVGESPEPIKIHLIFLNEKGPGKFLNCSLFLLLEGGGQTASFRREAPVGILRETIRISSRGGARTVFFTARLSELASTSLLDVEPLRIDFGAVRPGDQITRRVQVTNRGKEPLKWKAGLPMKKRMTETELVTKGRYVSFLNEAAVGAGSYPASGQLREGLELAGPWAEEGGYPVSQSDRSILRYRFTGTGISLFIKKMPDGGPVTVFIDEQFVNLFDGFSDRRERVEILITDDQPEVSHSLAIVNGGGRVIVEGVRIFGKPVLKGPSGWINIFPNSGMTTRETDYVNIVLNANRLAPGVYGEQIFFTSNGGEADVEVFLEVAAVTQTRFLDVHRYLAGTDYLFSTNPQAEASRLQGYRHLGIAFRLFSPGTPGTTDFSRWFNPVKGDHFYSTDPAGGGKPPAGYLFEGSIGNIATFRLAGTRELYRWYHPGKGVHFYTTDQGGEGLGKKGYRFDGIAGFVR
jgi:Repeat of unknown function (DUF5648)